MPNTKHFSPKTKWHYAHSKRHDVTMLVLGGTGMAGSVGLCMLHLTLKPAQVPYISSSEFFVCVNAPQMQ